MIPSIDSYSKDEIEGFLNFSSAGDIYFNLLKLENLDPIYRIRHQAWLKVALDNFHSKTDQKQRSAYWSLSMDLIVKSIFETYFTSKDSILILALGKYGSQVLNLSSDIDIILVADGPITQDLTKKARLFLQHLNAKTPYGFLTRVDLNLKPNKQPGIITESNNLTSYLWQSTELWERLIYTRARKICGQLKDETSLFSEINKFCFRKYIRLDLIVGLSDLIQKIMDHNLDEKNIKLCPGGIRSVELLLSAIQLLFGGRVPEFQSANTYNILNSLDKLHLYSESQIQNLISNYNTLRILEDRMQCILDEQTHTLLDSTDLSQVFLENKKNIQIFLSTIERGESTQASSLLDHLHQLLAEHPHLDEFIQFLKKHSAYIALFEKHPKSYGNLLKSLIYSPQVTKLILLRPDLMDMFLLKKTFLESEDSDEEFLIQLSDFKSISQITAIGEFLTELDINKFLIKNSKIADFSVTQIFNRVFNEKDVEILKLGKWSGNELGVFSDLDFIFVAKNETDRSKKSRKFISYLTHGTFHGPFYSIDLRLRPSGHAGPILTTNEKLKDYLENSAPVWLRQAYLRNKFLISQNKFIFSVKTPTEIEQKELIDIRMKRFTIATSNSISIKDSFGGIVDLEFYIQCCFLKLSQLPETDTFNEQVEELHQLKILDSNQSLYLKGTYTKLRILEQLSEILFRNSKINEINFVQISKIESYQNSLYKYDNFESLLQELLDNQKFIDERHPFLNPF